MLAELSLKIRVCSSSSSSSCAGVARGGAGGGDDTSGGAPVLGPGPCPEKVITLSRALGARGLIAGGNGCRAGGPEGFIAGGLAVASTLGRGIGGKREAGRGTAGTRGAGGTSGNGGISVWAEPGRAGSGALTGMLESS